MKPISLLLVLACACLPSVVVTAADTASALPRKKILFFSKSSGFEHAVITSKNGEPTFVERALVELGAKHNLAFTFSKDGTLFTPIYLSQFDAFFFYTTGVLTERRDTKNRGDDNPLMTEAGKTALLEAIDHGKGFIGAHSASDTFHRPGDDEIGPRRHTADGDQADPYIKMLGGEFIMHGDQQKSHLLVADPKFPGIAAVPADFSPLEEWYTLKNFSPDLHVILVQDTAGMTGNEYARPPYPSTWARMQGRGRVFYTSMGHREDVWTNPIFQAILLGGINWATGRVQADVTPNLATAAPRAGELQPYVPRKP